MADALHLPDAWEEALARAAMCARVAVIGPMDVGKSSFAWALAERRPGLKVIDLDPGQKMIGPPGSATLGTLVPEVRLERFIFLGSTAVASFSAISGAASALAGSVRGPFVVNTSGYVEGPGARLQAMTLAAIRPELVVAIGASPGLEPVLAKLPEERVARLDPSPYARRKTEGERRRIRQASFAAALAGAEELALTAPFDPAPPRAFEGAARPVCCLADAKGEDMGIGIVCQTREEGVRVLATPPPRPAAAIRLGRMWASPGEGGWKLLERLTPAWAEG